MALYDRITPANLNNLSALVNNPAGSEDANQLYLVDLQTRRFVYDFLISRFDSAASDVLKAAAIVDATVAGKIKGSTGNAGTQQAIVQGTVSTPDLRDAAVTSAKIAASAITTSLLTDAAVTTAKHADAPNGITTAKINDGQITTPKLATDSVDATILKDSSSTDSDR